MVHSHLIKLGKFFFSTLVQLNGMNFFKHVRVTDLSVFCLAHFVAAARRHKTGQKTGSKEMFAKNS